MNVIYLIGNGFDLSLGLPTAYSDFYKYYLEQSSKGATIKDLKNDIQENIVNWADLEKTLGEHTINLHTREDMDTVHKDLADNLIHYVHNVEKHYNGNDSQSVEINKHLIYPELHLLPTDEKQISRFKSKWANQTWNIDIISFNYTSVLERLIGFKTQNKSLGTHNQNGGVSLRNVEHIHGDKRSNMALGVNDASQFLNEDFRNDELLRYKYIKPNLNAIRRTGHDEACQELIRNANLICVYGLSLGLTDLRWWQYIGERMKNNYTLLVIFFYDPKFNLSEIDDATLYYEEGEIKKMFLGRTSLPKNDMNDIKQKIFVRINSRMFKIDNAKFRYNSEWNNPFA